VLVATKLLTAKLDSLYIKGSESLVGVGVAVGNFEKVGVEHFTSHSATLS